MNSTLHRMYGSDAEYFMIDGEITEELMAKIWEDIYKSFRENPKKIFVLVITSSGGTLVPSLNFYFKIKFWEVQLVTVAVGSVFSAGAIIYLAGSERLAYRGASFLLHEPKASLENVTLDRVQLKKLHLGLRQARKQIQHILNHELHLISSKHLQQLIDDEAIILDAEARDMGLAHRIID